MILDVKTDVMTASSYVSYELELQPLIDWSISQIIDQNIIYKLCSSSNHLSIVLSKVMDTLKHFLVPGS